MINRSKSYVAKANIDIFVSIKCKVILIDQLNSFSLGGTISVTKSFMSFLFGKGSSLDPGFWSFEGLQNTKHEQLTPDVSLRFKFTFRFVHLGALLARFLISFWFEKKQFLFAKTRIFRAFFFFDTFVFCVASLFLHKSSSFFFESVTREEQNPIRTP